MKTGRLVLGILLVLLLLSMVAVGIAMAHAYRLRGEWSAVVVIVDGVVLGWAGLMALLGWVLRRRMRDGAPGSRLVWLAAWCLLGPLPASLFAVFHCLKVFA